MAESGLRADLRDWLARYHLEQYAGVLEQHEVLDVELVQQLTEGDLTALGITKVGARRRFLNAIEQERRMSGGADEAFGGMKVVEADLGPLTLPPTWQDGLAATDAGRYHTAETQRSATEPSYGPSAESSLYTDRDKPSRFVTPQPSMLGLEAGTGVSFRHSGDLLPAASKQTLWAQELQASGKPPLPPYIDDSRRSSGIDDATATLITDNMVNVSQAIGLLRGSTPLLKSRGPEAKDADPAQLPTISQRYMDAQSRFMAMAKDRAHSQERFLAEAEEMKGLGDQESMDFVGTVRKYICQSPLLVRKEDNLRGRSSSRQRASVMPPWGDALDVLAADGLPASSAPGRKPRASPMRRVGGVPTVSPMRPAMPTKSSWQQLLHDQEQMHDAMRGRDEEYRKVMERLVETEKGAFGRLIGPEGVQELAVCFDGPASLRPSPPTAALSPFRPRTYR
eukprot:EG_transcript_2984